MTEPGRVRPEDQYNERLIGNVHPKSWKNPTASGRYNLVVIGAGTAGLVTAAGAAGLGARVALVERHLMGGDCLNVGCVPSKCIIRSSRVFSDFRDLTRFGAKVSAPIEADFPAVMERMRRLRAQISGNDSVWRFRDEKGVDVYLGDARFSGPDSITVDGQTLRFKGAVITTGARPLQLSIPGLDEVGYLTNETVFELVERPGRLAIIGAGPIGCELAQAFQRLGCEVVLLDVADSVLGKEDADAAEVIRQTLVREGVRLILSSRIERVRAVGSDKVLDVLYDGRQEEVAVDEILVGAGRTPNVDGLNLNVVGVRYDEKNGVQVNDELQTTNPRIYAAGDVCMQHKFTHMADAAARIVIQNALFFGKKKLSALHVPWCTYTDPEVARVGLSERDAADRGIAIDTYVRPFAEVDRAITDGEEDGFAKIIVRKGSDQILGATIVARHAGEMISEITLAVVAKIGLGQIAGVIHPYPTQAEAIRQLGDAYNRTRLTPLVKRLFQLWLKWTR